MGRPQAGQAEPVEKGLGLGGIYLAQGGFHALYSAVDALHHFHEVLDLAGRVAYLKNTLWISSWNSRIWHRIFVIPGESVGVAESPQPFTQSSRHVW